MRDVKITETVKSSFLEYAMSVIVSRAIPDVRDGLKPVHRRIIYGMNELGIGPTKPFKKSARIVGDVMGKYHPHGDSAIYGSLVRLAQPFNMRYTLVDGHGNFGSIDGDEAAAMRYTEARMSKIAMEMVRDIDQDTVDFMDNYDGQEKEPTVLPSRFPNLIVNGSNGIAVGMATNMPPHNLVETINAIQAIAENPDITPVELMTTCIYGPDFPTGGIILGRSGIRKAYETGQGSIVVRSKAEIIEHENGKKRIVISEIPYGVNKALTIEHIAHLVKDKVIEGITDIRDESNKEGIRVVIELRRDAIAEVILNKLYKLTALQSSFGIINLCLVNGEPKILPITDLLKNYLDFQVEVVGRRTRTLLKKAEARDHILQGLKIAIDNIDEVVDIIKQASSTEVAKNNLISRFGITDIQAKEILDMRLSKLTGLEKTKIEDEITRLNAQIEEYKVILSDRKNELKVVIDELEEIKNKFGDERRTYISNEISNIDDEDLIPEEEIIITLTKNGYIKRVATDTFRTQNRGGRGVKGMQTHEDDVVDILVHAKTHTDLLFFTSYGKVYRMRGYQVPVFSRSSKGLPVVNLLNLEKDEFVRSIISVDEYKEGDYLFFATEQGVVKRTSIKEYESIRQNGKIAISLREGDHLLDVKMTNGNAIIGIASSLGKMVNFNENAVRPMGRTASGVRGMNIDEGIAVGMVTSLEGEYILAITDKGYGKMTHYSDYRLTSRGTKGVITIHATEKVGNLVTIRAVDGNEDLMVITKAGIIIRIPLDQVKVAGRNTQGVRIIRLDENQTVSSVAVVEHQEQEEVVEEENKENE
ncbi:MAG: DNA gyrase subunit A [Erysipelotrichaceae bacterium]|nr:DNA gyrase subunit A [Erysipelotrichaceae bacterium]